jgi:hypothetical protein
MEAEVFETASGLAVVSTDVESVRVALRRQRRDEQRLRAKRRSQRRTGGSKGKATWAGKVKARKQHERVMARPYFQQDQ